MAGSRPTAETPGQKGLTGLEKELHREDAPRGGSFTGLEKELHEAIEDPASLRERKARYREIPIPDGLPELPPSSLATRPTPGMMPAKRKPQPPVVPPPVKLEASQTQHEIQTPPEQAQPLGDAALTLTVDENLGAAHVPTLMERPPADQQPPPAEPQA